MVASLERSSDAQYLVAASNLIVDVDEVVLRIEANRLGHTCNLEPENSSKDQYHAHDICKLTSSPDLAHDRSHHPPDSPHIQVHPRRNPHKRLDGSKNFAASPHNVAPMNFYFDSHWQLSRRTRLNYIWAKTLGVIRRYPQCLCVVYDVVATVLIEPRIRKVLQRVIQQAKESR